MAALARDFRTAPLEPATRVLLDYADKLTRTPAAVREADVQGLRGAGFSDLDILDAAHIIGWFNHVNRLADGLGVAPEPE